MVVLIAVDTHVPDGTPAAAVFAAAAGVVNVLANEFHAAIGEGKLCAAFVQAAGRRLDWAPAVGGVDGVDGISTTHHDKAGSTACPAVLLTNSSKRQSQLITESILDVVGLFANQERVGRTIFDVAELRWGLFYTQSAT